MTLTPTPNSRYRKYIVSTSYEALLAMSPCRWPQIGWFRCQTAHILQKSNTGFQLGEAATCRWELSTKFWMWRQSRTDTNPPSELFELKRRIFLNWMCFISTQKTQITSRSILLCSYYTWVLSTSFKERARTRTWTTRRLQHSQRVNIRDRGDAWSFCS